MKFTLFFILTLFQFYCFAQVRIYSPGVNSTSKIKRTASSWRFDEFLCFGNEYTYQFFKISEENLKQIVSDENNYRNGFAIDLEQELPKYQNTNQYKAGLFTIYNYKKDVKPTCFDLQFYLNSKDVNYNAYEYNYVKFSNKITWSVEYPEFPEDAYAEETKPRASTFNQKKILTKRYLIIFKGDNLKEEGMNQLRIVNQNGKIIEYEF